MHALLTWHGFDIVGRMHGHHLCIDTHAIVVERVQMSRQLNQGQWRLRFRIEVSLQGIRAIVDISIAHRHSDACSSSPFPVCEEIALARVG